MDPFIIVKNYRQIRQQEEASPPPPRIFLRELDPNSLVPRQPTFKPASRCFAEDDKENFNHMLDMYLGD